MMRPAKPVYTLHTDGPAHDFNLNITHTIVENRFSVIVIPIGLLSEFSITGKSAMHGHFLDLQIPQDNPWLLLDQTFI